MTALTETSRSGVFQEGGQSRMTWEAPAFVEIKMDAEINSYQDDFDREQDDRF
jgi:coenzyme PQQ precursor peptide PqqA